MRRYGGVPGKLLKYGYLRYASPMLVPSLHQYQPTRSRYRTALYAY